MALNNTDITNTTDIELLINTFYNKVRKDDTIGFIFNDIIGDDWSRHLPIMYQFWTTVLLGKAGYTGNPVRKHIEVDSKIELKSDHYERWLTLWEETIDHLYVGNIADNAKAKAQNDDAVNRHEGLCCQRWKIYYVIPYCYLYSMSYFSVQGHLVDVFENRTYPAIVTIKDGKIASIVETNDAPDQYILPGFVDAHVHIESSMLVPTAFAQMAVVHGTVATVSDPHEIANVCGTSGVHYMINNGKRTLFKFFFGAPSCVPATFFETAGAHIDADDIEKLLNNDDVWYLAEMMNYPGVLNGDTEVIAKINAAKKIGKPIDGHAPGLRGDEAHKYAANGISTDHECFTIEEALDKLKAGMKIIIREGSAARNFDALAPLFETNADKLMFCSDDKHPDELITGHINELVKRAIKEGYDLYDVIKAASLNPITHYNLPVGMLREKDSADFIVVNNLKDFEVKQTYIDGEMVADNGMSLLTHSKPEPINYFDVSSKKVDEFIVEAQNESVEIRVIEALDGQLITNEITANAKVENKNIVSDIDNDILKMVVVNRYANDVPIAKAFIKNIGINKGALASTVAHDCHNIIAVGTTDEAICEAVNALIKSKGGIAVIDDKKQATVLPLPIAGLMSDRDGQYVADAYSNLDKKAKNLGSKLRAPFMTLSFMALLVIPSLKLSDKGLFDGSKFEFTPIEL